MSSNNPDLYMKIERNVVVTERKVKLSDIAKFECIDKNIINHINTITVLTFPKERVAPYVVSVLKIIEMIHEIYPNITVNNEGETSFVINLKEKEPAKWIKIIKVLFVCMITFFGASFSIMTFNNDVGLDTMFIQLYSLMTGYERQELPAEHKKQRAENQPDSKGIRKADKIALLHALHLACSVVLAHEACAGHIEGCHGIINHRIRIRSSGVSLDHQRIKGVDTCLNEQVGNRKDGILQPRRDPQKQNALCHIGIQTDLLQMKCIAVLHSGQCMQNQCR